MSSGADSPRTPDEPAPQETPGLALPGASLFFSLAQEAPAPAFVIDAEGRCLFLNKAGEDLLGLVAGQWKLQTEAQLWPAENALVLGRLRRDALAGKAATGQILVRGVLPGSQDDRRFLLTAFPLGREGQAGAVAVLAADVTSLTKAEKKLRLSEERFRIIAEYAQDWETWISPEGDVWYVSPACERITGLPRARFLDDADFIKKIIHPDDLTPWIRARESIDEGADRAKAEYRILREDGQERWLAHSCQRIFDDAGQPLGLRVTRRDITDRKLVEMQLQHQAYHDHLTGLPNRALCLDRIALALARSKRRDNYRYALLFIDLDRFKVINDSMGQAMGDLLLTAVAKRLQECVRNLDTVSRLTGDEFVILLEEIASFREGIRVVKRIRERMEAPFTIQGQEVHASASIGVVLSPAIYDKPEDLLRNAAIAMRRAKILGRNRFKVFHIRMLEETIHLMHMEMDLRQALERKEFFLQYQPILSLGSRRLTGLEALVRWNRPERGVIPPGDFISLAEETGLIIPLGLWVLRRACQAMAEWERTSPAAIGLSMHVNLSAKQLRHQDLADEVAAILKETGLKPESLKLEITESVLMDNPDMAILILKRLKALGVKMSIDDFGTGYSSLSYLQRFPVDTLKVDRSFVSRMGLEPENLEIVKAVIALAHSLALDVVAEGVELEEQSALLAALGCEHVQGYLFSRPLPEDAVAGYLDLALQAALPRP